MSRTPGPRSSHTSGLAPSPSNAMQPMRGSSIFVPPGAPGPPSAVPSLTPSRVEPPPLSATMGPMPGTLERPIHGPRKRLIVTCDGTWLDSDNGLMNGHKQPPSNVSRIGWAIKDTSRDGIPQIVHYQAGIGTSGGAVTRFVGGAIGGGLKENVREAYTYLAINYRHGDEIFLMGFSRGAFTARSVGGLIGEMGLLTRAGLPSFNEIFEDVEHRRDEKYVSKFPDIPFPEKGRFDSTYLAEMQERGLTRTDIPIKAICCWDTVGNLGIPRVPFLEAIGIQTKDMRDYQFYDTKLNPNVENAFQALALDERRAPFSPALWEKRESDKTNLKQVWFPGVHSNIGGGYDDQELANISLAWMMSRLEPFLDFRPEYLIGCHEENRRYYKQTEQKPRWWSFGELYNSVKGVYSLTGSKARTPGAYYRTDPFTGRTLEKKLKNTNEYFHASIRSRLGLRGPGVLDRGHYDPPAIRDWTFAEEPAPAGQGGNAEGMMVVWTNHNADKLGGQDRIPEAVLLETELILLRNFPKVEEYIRTMKEPVREKRRSRRVDGAVANGVAAPLAEHRKHRERSEHRDPSKARKRKSRRHDG